MNTSDVKSQILNAIKEVLKNKNYERIAEFLAVHSDPLYHPIIIKTGVLHALESSDEEKMEYCNLMSYLKQKHNLKYWAFS